MTSKDTAQRIVDRLKDIPTLPQVVQKIIEIVDKPTTSASDLNKAISMDQALTAKILKLVNSAFYGFPKKIETLTQAIVILGFNTVRSLALSISMVDFFTGPKTGGRVRLNYVEYWRHSISVSVIARELAKKAYPSIAEEAFVAGLLHDIGIIVLDQFIPAEYTKVMQTMQEEKTTLFQTERKMMGITHSEVGQMLATRWNMPDPLTCAIAYHHEPSPARDYFPITAVIHAADIGAKILHLGGVSDDEAIRPHHINEDVRLKLRLDLDFPNDMKDKTEKLLSEGDSFLSAIMGK